MGSGSSSRSAAALRDDSISEQKVKAKYKVSRVCLDASEHYQDKDDGRGNIRPCDKCGETRKTVRFGGASAQWLCAACHLDGNVDAGDTVVAALPVLRRSMTSQDVALAAPQPVLTRRASVNLECITSSALGVQGDSSPSPKRILRKQRSSKVTGANAWTSLGQAACPAHDVGALGEGDLPEPVRPPATSAAAPAARRARQGAKERVALGALDRGQLECRQESTTDQRGRQRQAGCVYPGDADEIDSPKPQALPLLTHRKIPGGEFSLNDKVVSLISRVRGGVLVLELGHEGLVVGARGGDSGEELRLLVQFTGGYDWLLPPCQLCALSSWASSKATRGSRMSTTGTRVRSLVTYMKPAKAKRDLWLGDAGTVIGPGASPGKLAVRFDEAGEWSVWPTAVCKAEAYSSIVQERLAGCYCRGDRVRTLAPAVGSRSCDGAAIRPGGQGSHMLNSGEQGTVVGPGHLLGRVLVHFDSDERVWSLRSDRLERC